MYISNTTNVSLTNGVFIGKVYTDFNYNVSRNRCFIFNRNNSIYNRTDNNHQWIFVLNISSIWSLTCNTSHPNAVIRYHADSGMEHPHQ